MARVFTVKSSRPSRRPKICGFCREEITPPDGYLWAAPGYHAPKRYRHLNHPFKGSDLISGMRAEPEAARESFEDTLNAIEHDAEDALEQITAAVEEFAGEVRQYADARQQALDAWGNGNGQLEELNDTAETAADKAESHEVEEFPGDPELLEEFTDEEPVEPEIEDEPVSNDYDDEGEFDAAYSDYESSVTAHELWETEHDDWEAKRDAHSEAREEYERHVEQQIEAALEMAQELEF